MTKYILRRFLINIPILFGITILVFLFIALAPGDPLSAYVNPEMGMSEEAMNALRAKFGLDQPLHIRYFNWLGEVLQGNLGFRTKTFEPVTEVISRRLGATLLLMASGLGLGLLVGVPLGVVSAVRQYSALDMVLTAVAFTGISIPSFFAGLAALYLFAVRIPIFPAGGMRTIGEPNSLLDLLHHLVLPALVLGFAYIAILLRYTRAAMLEVVGSDYIRTARAKGLTEPLVILRHAFRNALIPIITVIGLTLPALIAGAVFTETVFSWPGMGTLFVDGVTSRDFPLIMGMTLIIAVVVLTVNLLTDIAYAVANPTIRYD